MQHFYNVSSTLIRQQPSDQTHVFFLNHFLRWSSYFWLLQPQLPCLRDYLADSYLSIHPSIHLSIYLACLSNCVSSYRPIYLSIYQSINLSIYLSLSTGPPNRGGRRHQGASPFYYQRVAILCDCEFFRLVTVAQNAVPDQITQPLPSSAHKKTVETHKRNQPLPSDVHKILGDHDTNSGYVAAGSAPQPNFCIYQSHVSKRGFIKMGTPKIE